MQRRLASREIDDVELVVILSQVSEDGGRTFTDVGEHNKHVDNHYVWIDPDDTDHLLEGCDGGLYETWDRGKLWRHFANLSVTQFYNVEVDNASPIYNIYGGTQDNGSIGTPSRSVHPSGIRASEGLPALSDHRSDVLQNYCTFPREENHEETEQGGVALRIRCSRCFRIGRLCPGQDD